MRKPNSLAQRVLLFVAAAVLLCAALLAFSLQRSIEQHFAEQDAGELQAIAVSLNLLLQQQAGLLHAVDETHTAPAHQHGQLPQASLQQVLTGHHETFYLITSSDGHPLYQSAGVDLTPLLKLGPALTQITPIDLQSYQQQGRSFRGAVFAGDHGHQIVVAMAMDFHLHYLHLLSWTLWLSVCLAVALILLAAWLGVRQGLKPLAELSQQLESISAQALETRLDEQLVPAELSSLVKSVNQMIERLEQSFAQLSHFSADIAHELRTPLSNLITQTQVALGKERSAAEYRELLYSNLEEQERLNRMVSDMLWLAKSDHGLMTLQRTQVDVRQQAEQLLEFFELLADEKPVQLALTVSAATPCVVNGDRDMLRRALSNLLSNAIRHAEPGTVVELSISEQAPSWFMHTPAHPMLWLSVRNQGALIPAHLQSRIFDRFFRADPARQRHSDGAGLGLAIVKSTAQLHQGLVAVQSDDQGTEFVLALPSK
ncbi:MAG TPA: two-component sensor histidine kinase [Rheinheimera sp.]|nr:two-component sensor histidine kinase [Rheinheimera sp.]